MNELQQTGFIFPGQGSQSLGMLADFADKFSSVKSVFDQASEALAYDLWDVCQNDEARLNQTQVTQPAILTASVALWHICQEQSPFEPAYMAGHSLGEYSALVCAGVLSLADAVKLVEDRGNYMQEAVPAGQGAMAAILGLEDELVKQACAQAAENEVASAVNFNAPGQVVIAGNKAAIDRAIVLCKEAGARKAMPLAVSVPSHCALMAPAAQKLSKRLEQITLNAPEIPVVNNVDVACVSEPELIRDALVRQLTDAVRWVESVEYMIGQGLDTLVECGPGKVLSGLGKRIDKSATFKALNTPDALVDFCGTV